MKAQGVRHGCVVSPLMLCVMLAAPRLHAGGPRFVTGTTFASAPAGQPMAFYTNSPMYYTDPGKLAPEGALRCDVDIVHRLARVGTRLSDLGADVSKQLVNWGYAISDRSVRARYKGQVSGVPAEWPFPDQALG